jgi:hypothetical protein
MLFPTSAAKLFLSESARGGYYGREWHVPSRRLPEAVTPQPMANGRFNDLLLGMRFSTLEAELKGCPTQGLGRGWGKPCRE